MKGKIDIIDKKILYELDKNARIPDTQLAKKIRKSKESVRYRIQKLKEKGIIKGFSIWIDPTKLGYITAKIYISLSNKPRRKKEFVDYAKKDKRLLWLGIAEGAWNAGLTYFVKNNEEFFELKNELFSKFNDLILSSSTGVLVDINSCDKNFLQDGQNHWKTMADEIKHYDLEEIEKHILKELFKNSRINVIHIAHKYNSTVDIVRRRIKKLEEKKIIFRYTISIDYSRIGYDFYKTFLYFRNLTKQDEARLRNFCLNQKNIVHLIRQISPWDIELEILCEGHAEYNEIISQVTDKFSPIIEKVDAAIMGQDYVFPSP